MENNRAALASQSPTQNPEADMFLLISIILFGAWIVGLTLLKIGALSFHLLVFFAAASLMTHFFRRARHDNSRGVDQ